MDPDELEFIGEKTTLGVIPNFNFDPIHLISGSIGPFRAGLPVHVPLWLAIHMRQQQKCRIVPPDWMDRDVLEETKEAEKREGNFTKMPCDHYMSVSKLLISNAAEDIPNLEEIKTLIKDIFDIRMAKLRTAMDLVIGTEGEGESSRRVSFNNLTILEIHTVRPFLPHAVDLVARLERVSQAHTQNSTNMSISGFQNSSNVHTSSYSSPYH